MEEISHAGGELAARYEILERIGAGGMAEVYRARVRVAGWSDVVALKRLLPEWAADPQLAELLVREAEIGKLVQHPCLVRVYDLEQLDGEDWLVMELVEGLDLARLLRIGAGRVRFPIEAAIRIALEALDGLHHLHGTCDAEGRALGVVHRDVSPANLIVGETGDVRLIDFGICARRDRPGHTRVGEIKGKPRWMAPEQVLGGSIDARTDVFALGMVLLMLVSGRDPYDGATPDEILARIKKGGIATLPPLEASVPRGLEKILARALAADPQARFRDASAFRASLREWAIASGIDVGPRALSELVLQVRALDSDSPLSLPEPGADEPVTMTGAGIKTAAIPMEVARRIPTISVEAEPSDEFVAADEGDAISSTALSPKPREATPLGLAKVELQWTNAILIAGGLFAFAVGIVLASL